MIDGWTFEITVYVLGKDGTAVSRQFLDSFRVTRELRQVELLVDVPQP